MAGRQGKNRLYEWRRNRNRVLTILMKQPLHFSELLRRLRALYGTFSSATLTGHLERLLDEGRIKRQVEGRKIVYVVTEEKQKQTVLDMRKECYKELALLMFNYGICLTKEVQGKLLIAIEALKESIKQRKRDVTPSEIMLGVRLDDLEHTYIGRLKIELKKEVKNNG